MRYVSLDLEMSGPDPLRHQVLELAAVVEDTRRAAATPLDALPAFRRALRHPEICGTAGALALNAGLLHELADKAKADAPDICRPEEVLPQLREFLLANGFKLDKKDRVSVTLAGKNVATFDLLFLRQLPGWGTLIKAEPATLDPAAFLPQLAQGQPPTHHAHLPGPRRRRRAPRGPPSPGRRPGSRAPAAPLLRASGV